MSVSRHHHLRHRWARDFLWEFFVLSCFALSTLWCHYLYSNTTFSALIPAETLIICGVSALLTAVLAWNAVCIIALRLCLARILPHTTALFLLRALGRWGSAHTRRIAVRSLVRASTTAALTSTVALCGANASDLPTPETDFIMSDTPHSSILVLDAPASDAQAAGEIGADAGTSKDEKLASATESTLSPTPVLPAPVSAELPAQSAASTASSTTPALPTPVFDSETPGQAFVDDINITIPMPPLPQPYGADTHTVMPPGLIEDTTDITVTTGDCLWNIAQEHFQTSDPVRISAAVEHIYALNANTIGSDPNIIHPGMVLHLPTIFQESR